jgi:hypothetical protein
VDHADLRAAVLLHVGSDHSLADSTGASDQGHLPMVLLTLAQNYCPGLDLLAFGAGIVLGVSRDRHKEYP